MLRYPACLLGITTSPSQKTLVVSISLSSPPQQPPPKPDTGPLLLEKYVEPRGLLESSISINRVVRVAQATFLRMIRPSRLYATTWRS